MIVYSVSVKVKSGHEDDFRLASKFNRQETRKEMGNLRFDILQSATDPKHFMLYEVYRSEDAVTAHKATMHYKKWRETVAPWMEEDRKGEEFIPRHPVEVEEW
ncbi:MAG: antibiotic biosynthesis monooxygenase [Spirochaetales bacterium]|nr:antibiotic biosynthesis monooxygenase [Spirochaetales bacterium]